jgi:hypothetical protein
MTTIEQRIIHFLLPKNPTPEELKKVYEKTIAYSAQYYSYYEHRTGKFIAKQLGLSESFVCRLLQKNLHMENPAIIVQLFKTQKRI